MALKMGFVIFQLPTTRRLSSKPRWMSMSRVSPRQTTMLPGGTHRYFFRLHALDDRPDLGAEVTKERLIGAMEGHVLAVGRLMGTYSR
jgi:phosphatidylethanolamine-binding protein (PEBP) family uncharacterized protein